MSEVSTELQSGEASGYDAVLADIAALLETARRAAARRVNAVMTATYWQIGQFPYQVLIGACLGTAIGWGISHRPRPPSPR